MIVKELVCLSCIHFRPLEGGCTAFPEGIPMEITEEGDPHKKPLPGQGNKLVYEQDKDALKV